MAKKRLSVADLAELIRVNPNAVFTVDNDCWWMDRESYDQAPDDDDDPDAYDRWEKNNRICSSDDMGYTGNGYGSGSTYGGDILQALALIVGVTVESV